MNERIETEKCLSFINSQLRDNGRGHGRSEQNLPISAVTISRQARCGARVVAEALAKYLQARMPRDEPPWTVFDRNLVQTVLEDHHLPSRLAKFMPENRISEISDTLD